MSKKVYLIQASLEGVTYYKIGYTTRTGKRRAKDLYTANPSEMIVIAEFETPHAALLESCLLNHFQRFKIRGEWFTDEAELDKDNFLKLCEKFNSNLNVLADNNDWFKSKILKTK